MPKGPQTTRFRYRKSSLFGNSTPSLCELACSISAVIDSKLLGSKSAFVLVNLRTPRQFQAEVSNGQSPPIPLISCLSAPQSAGSFSVQSGSSLQTHCRLRSVGNRKAHSTCVFFHPSHTVGTGVRIFDHSFTQLFLSN
ncbi:UNVERIFIED_CONTAM: hypothetical protein NCL1_35718 [Trichonephila clavipes]